MEDDFCWRDGGWGGGLISSCFSLWPIVSLCCSHSAARECIFVHLILRSPSFLTISCSRLKSELLYLWLSLNPPLWKKTFSNLFFEFLLSLTIYLTWHFSVRRCTSVLGKDVASLCLSASLLPPIVSTLFPSCLRLQHMLWDGCLGGGGYVLAAPWKQASTSFHYGSVSIATTNLTHTKDTPLWRRKTGSDTGEQREDSLHFFTTPLFCHSIVKEVIEF